MFSNRFTDLDSEHWKSVQEPGASSKPPCMQDFSVRHRKDSSYTWNRSAFLDPLVECHSNTWTFKLYWNGPKLQP
ncbi:hypothetical protein PoB_006193900 [Plakobranchus ocellatus]|uniref:Uncharacterized protein n=1 Tax=Plakobranchus ocellatus TaxID=259542 RepID=A0AAV4CU60_9GAST|nr:hypothetical protein PoB_006193900 [Plakobranchus ocellatus]